MTSRVELAFAKHELTFMHWLVMAYLHNGKAKTAAELCRRIHYDSGALTRIIDHLSKRGFIERNRNTDDRRSVQLDLTYCGQNIVESLKPIIVNCLNAAVSGLTHEEIDTLSHLLNKLIHGISISSEMESALSGT